MARRRKKGFNLNFILIALLLAVGAWAAADYYFNVWQKRPDQAPVAKTVPLAVEKTEPAKKETAPAADEKFEMKTYRDDRLGFELQYPVALKDPQSCPALEKTADGFSLGIFNFSANDKSGALDDFINSELEGMTVDNRSDITVAGLSAKKVDYETTGMGFSGSDVFVENNGKIFEFGFLANEASAGCGGVDDYPDRVYQSVTASLKFTN